MIKEIVIGDITNQEYTEDIIIGMNTELQEVNGVGKEYAEELLATLIHPLELGSILSFRFNRKGHNLASRNIHMVVCHTIGKSGWLNAHKYVRLALDRLEFDNGKYSEHREFSIVQIGTGLIGKRDGADEVAIRTAIDQSYLPVRLFVRDEGILLPTFEAGKGNLVAYAAWDQTHGYRNLALVA